MVVTLAEAYELTGEQRLLDRAIATHDFVLEGEDSYQGGGIYFREGSGGNKNTISTLQEARGAAMIYQRQASNDSSTMRFACSSGPTATCSAVTGSTIRIIGQLILVTFRMCL